jgi:HlyD family secretion protein
MNSYGQRLPATPPPLPTRERWLALTNTADPRGRDAGAPPERCKVSRPRPPQVSSADTAEVWGSATHTSPHGRWRHLISRQELTAKFKLAIQRLPEIGPIFLRQLGGVTQRFGRNPPLRSERTSRCVKLPAKFNLAIQRLPEIGPIFLRQLGGVIAALRPEPAPALRADEPMRQDLERAFARELRRGGRMLAIAAIVVLGWAGFVPLSGAVVVAGRLVVQSSVKKVQHPQGGIVASILVRNGTKVAAGEELARLDQTSARSNLQVVARQLDEARMRIARLTAERDNLPTPRWPTKSAAQLDNAEREQLLASEQDFFAARASTRRGQKELADSRVTQLEKQIAGLEAQLQSNGKKMGIASGELRGVEDLLRQKLVTLPRATALQRETAHLDGIDGQLAAQIAETRAKVSEARLQALQAEQTFRSDVMRDLREAEAKEGELMERHLAAEDQMNRTIIRAPTSGTVHELAVHTVGGIVAPAEVLMLVVPENDTLAIDARLSADKVDQVHAGQTAHVRLSAFNQRTTPELAGVVALVSADIVREPQSNATYYDVRIDLPPREVLRLGRLQLIPGMPAEVFLETESRTMLSYLFKPVTDQLSRMFRER